MPRQGERALYQGRGAGRCVKERAGYGFIYAAIALVCCNRKLGRHPLLVARAADQACPSASNLIEHVGLPHSDNIFENPQPGQTR